MMGVTSEASLTGEGLAFPGFVRASHAPEEEMGGFGVTSVRGKRSGERTHEVNVRRNA